jgi:hypothetical protein
MTIDIDEQIRTALGSVQPHARFATQLLQALEHSTIRPLHGIEDVVPQAEHRWLAPVAGAVSAVGVAGAAWYGLRRHNRKGAA